MYLITSNVFYGINPTELGYVLSHNDDHSFFHGPNEMQPYQSHSYSCAASGPAVERKVHHLWHPIELDSTNSSIVQKPGRAPILFRVAPLSTISQIRMISVMLTNIYCNRNILSIFWVQVGLSSTR